MGCSSEDLVHAEAANERPVKSMPSSGPSIPRSGEAGHVARRKPEAEVAFERDDLSEVKLERLPHDPLAVFIDQIRSDCGFDHVERGHARRRQ